MNKRRVHGSELKSILYELLLDQIREIPQTGIIVDEPLDELYLFEKHAPLENSGQGIRGHLIVYRDATWVIEQLRSIDRLDTWFPDHKAKIPLAFIQIIEPGSEVEGKEYLEAILKSLPFSETIFACIVSIDHVWAFDSSSGDFVDYLIDHRTAEEFTQSLITPCIDHVVNTTKDEVCENIDLDDLANNFDPEIFHFEEVHRAYTDGRTGILILLLSVYFERYVENELESELQSLKANDHAGKIHIEWRFKEMLNVSRFLGLIEDSDYNTIDKIRDARNSYAHDIMAFHQTQKTDAEQEGILEEGIRLYQELVGIRDELIL